MKGLKVKDQIKVEIYKRTSNPHLCRKWLLTVALVKLSYGIGEHLWISTLDFSLTIAIFFIFLVALGRAKKKHLKMQERGRVSLSGITPKGESRECDTQPLSSLL